MKKIVLPIVSALGLFLFSVTPAFAISGSLSANSNNQPVEQVTLTSSDIATINSLSMDTLTGNSGCGLPDHMTIGFLYGYAEDVVPLTPNDFLYDPYGSTWINSAGDEEGNTEGVDFPPNHPLHPGSYTYIESPHNNSWTDVLNGGDRAQLFVDIWNADESCNYDYIFTPIFSLSDVPYTFPTNIAPQVTSLSGGTINEGFAYNENGSFTDSDSTSWTATVDYGDGSGSQALTLNTDKTFSLDHVYKDNGTYTVTVNVTDNQSATGTVTTQVIVNNIAASVGSATPITATINSATSFTSNFTDPGILDTHTALWNWGDGSAQQNGTVTELNGSGSVTNSHTYTALGSYTVTLTVTDKDGATSTSQTVISAIPTTGLASGNLSHTNYSGANLSNQNMSKANLSVGTFNNVDFQSANLSQVNGSNSSLTNDNFTSANLTKVNFSNSNLSGSNFTNAIVTQGNLSNANLTNVNFTGANLQGANLSGTTKTGIIWSNTICPDNTNSDSHSNTCIGHGGGL